MVGENYIFFQLFLKFCPLCVLLLFSIADDPITYLLQLFLFYFYFRSTHRIHARVTTHVVLVYRTSLGQKSVFQPTVFTSPSATIALRIFLTLQQEDE